jgi:hypothetical protein
MMVSDTIVQSIIKERSGNLKHQLMVSGATLSSYWIANYIVDFCTHIIPGIIAKMCIVYLEIDAPKFEILVFWFALANPLCIYILSFIFDSDGKASILIRVFYIVIGGAAPITMQILNIFNSETKMRWAPMLQKFFIYAPVYNFNYAYLKNVNRFILAFVAKKDFNVKVEDVLSWGCMGESIYILQVSAAIGFGFVFIAEFGII